MDEITLPATDVDVLGLEFPFVGPSSKTNDVSESERLFMDVFSTQLLFQTILIRSQIDDTRLTIPGNVTFSHQWLRDSCQCPSCVHPSTSQKLHISSDIPADIRPTPDGLTTTAKGVHIRWTDGHVSFYEAAFLERYASSSTRLRFHRDTDQIHWDASSIAQTPDLYVPYTELVEPRRLLDAINQLTQYGLLFVTGVPNQHTANDTCELRALANIFGELRTTFYGELWDVKNSAQ
ncbi:hypothetical protein JVU11DRAFT_12076 [Chiua virens]|nr:hypothetical protein JVU11DRAFT_12076 [Chiua virens]